MELAPVKIERVIATVEQQFAVVLRAEEKCFLIFVGHPEAIALYRELRGGKTQRPFSHDVIRNLLSGFDIDLRMVVVSSIVNNVFCATLLLRQEVGEGQRKEVRLDLRASDAMIIALKCGKQLFVSRDVLDSVDDVTHLLDEAEDDAGEFGQEE